MSKLRRTSDGQMMFHCLGCQLSHGVYIDNPGPNRPVWGWNGSIESPTLQPSILVQWSYGDPPKSFRCHSFVRDGYIQFLSDCTHARKDQTIALPDWEDETS